MQNNHHSKLPAVPTHIYQHLNKNNPLLLTLCMLLCFLGYTLLLGNNLFPGGDSARFLMLAQSLLSGQGYRQIALVGNPYFTLAPPGFPLIIVPILAIFGYNIPILKLCMGLIALLTIPVVYTFYKRRYSPLYAAVITLAYGTTPVIVIYTRRIYSDITFLLIGLLVIFAVQKYAKERVLSLKYLGLTAACLGITFYLRTAGFALTLASILTLILHKHWRKAAVLLLIVLIIFAPWIIWRSHVVDEVSSYTFTFRTTSDLYQIITSALENIDSYIRLIAENLWYISTKAPIHIGIKPPLSQWLVTFTVFSVGFTILIGLYTCLHQGWEITDVFVVVYLLMLASFAFVTDRYIIAFIPFILNYYVKGLFAISRFSILHLTYSTRRILLLLILGGLLLSNVSHIAARIYQETHFATYAPSAHDLYTIARWAKEALPSNSIVFTDEPYLFYVYAQHQTVTPGTLTDFNKQSINYIVADTSQPHHYHALWGYTKDAFYANPLFCGTETALCLYAIPEKRP